MKNKSAFTLIELLVVIAIFCILASMFFGVIIKAYQHYHPSTSQSSAYVQPQTQPQSSPGVNMSGIGIGDMVSVNGMGVTGIVNSVNFDLHSADLQCKGADGKLFPVERINLSLLKKITP